MDREQVIRTIMIVVERLKGIPVGEHRVELVERKWFKENVRYVDPERHVKYGSVLAEGDERGRGIGGVYLSRLFHKYTNVFLLLFFNTPLLAAGLPHSSLSLGEG